MMEKEVMKMSNNFQNFEGCLHMLNALTWTILVLSVKHNVEYDKQMKEETENDEFNRRREET